MTRTSSQRDTQRMGLVGDWCEYYFLDSKGNVWRPSPTGQFVCLTERIPSDTLDLSAEDGEWLKGAKISPQ